MVYGDTSKDEEIFAKCYKGLIEAMRSHLRVCGFCWTQLTDIEQEQNGLFYYDRTPKFLKESYKK